MEKKNIWYYVGQILALVILLSSLVACIWIIYHIKDILKSIIHIVEPIGKIDAVIIVAIIGAIATFIVNIISKRLDHKFELKKYL